MIRIVIGSNGFAFKLKEELKKYIESLNEFEVYDIGTYDGVTNQSHHSVAMEMGCIMQAGESDYGFLFCGDGNGVAMVINKFRNVRAGVCHNEFMAMEAKKYSNANVLCSGIEMTDVEKMKKCFHKMIEEDFVGIGDFKLCETFCKEYGFDSTCEDENCSCSTKKKILDF